MVPGSQLQPGPMGAYWERPRAPSPEAAQLAPARRQPTLKLSDTLKTARSRTQQLPRSPLLSLTSRLVELVT